MTIEELIILDFKIRIAFSAVGLVAFFGVLRLWLRESCKDWR